MPVYSSIYTGLNEKTVELAATVSVRNVSGSLPLVLQSVRYFDSEGRKLRDYVSRPSVLGPRATVEFVIQEQDREGGPGASFEIEWEGAEVIDDPLVEAVMVGRVGTAGVSFTSPGRTVRGGR